MGGTLLFAIVMMGMPRLPAMLRFFAFSSLCLAGLIVTSSLMRGDEQPYAIATVNIVFKVILAPGILFFAARRRRLVSSESSKPNGNIFCRIVGASYFCSCLDAHGGRSIPFDRSRTSRSGFYGGSQGLVLTNNRFHDHGKRNRRLWSSYDRRVSIYD